MAHPTGLKSQIRKQFQKFKNTFNSESAEKHSTETETTTFKHPQEEPERPMDMYYNKLKAVFAKNVTIYD